MLRRPITLLGALALALSAASAAAQDHRDETELGVDLEASGQAGAMLGYDTRPVNMAVAILDARGRPWLEHGQWRLRVPLEVSHRQTFGAWLPETRGEGGLEVRWRLGPELRVYLDAGLEGVWRPAWPDQYQVEPDGSLRDTDRYSHSNAQIGFKVAAIPVRHHHARLRYRYEVTDYADDPGFDPVDEPTHLVPGDHDEHHIELDWHYHADEWKAGGGLDVVRRHYFLSYSRDAGTGLTHAGPGGPPPNPLETHWDIEPSVDAELELADGRVEIDVAYGHEFLVDTYEGYYSYQGPHPELGIEWHPTDDLVLEGSFDLKWRTYGSGSYAQGPSHPPLEEGDRRYDHRMTLGADGEYALTDQWALTAEAKWEVRRTNFPDYVPGVFPATRQYDIDWDYDNWTLLVGVRWTHGLGDAQD